MYNVVKLKFGIFAFLLIGCHGYSPNMSEGTGSEISKPDESDNEVSLPVDNEVSQPAFHDSDGDGVFNQVEIELGTDPFSKDSDGDGVDDGLEIYTYKTNPLRKDSDGDGSSDYDEVKNGTDPNGDDQSNLPDSIDSDNDGLSDNEEKDQGTNPSLADTDGDGLTDGEEANSLGTDPTSDDTDGGGMPDGEEIKEGRDPFDGDDDFGEAIDSDGDGISDHDEVTVGSDPEDPNDPEQQAALDSDGDGLSDDLEAELGTNPQSSDTDQDGLSDRIEVSLETDPLLEDTDGGGVSDGIEYKAGKDPFDANDDYGEMVGHEGEVPRFRVVIEHIESRGKGEVSKQISLGNGVVVESGQWVDMSELAEHAETDFAGLVISGNGSHLKVLLRTTLGRDDFEHISGYLEFANLDIINVRSAEGHQKLENGFDGVKKMIGGQDEVSHDWTNKVNFWLSANVADDAFIIDTKAASVELGEENPEEEALDINADTKCRSLGRFLKATRQHRPNDKWGTMVLSYEQWQQVRKQWKHQSYLRTVRHKDGRLYECRSL